MDEGNSLQESHVEYHRIEPKWDMRKILFNLLFGQLIAIGLVTGGVFT